MVRRIFASGVLAGLAAGAVAAALQAATTTPLILRAELLEAAGAAVGHVHAAADHSHSAVAGLTLARFALSSLATLIFGVGFALILVAFRAAGLGLWQPRRTSVAPLLTELRGRAA